MSDLKNFSKRIKRRASAVSKNTDNVVRKVILAVDQAVVFATPVDTGRARANWQPSIGAPITTTLPEPSGPNIGTGAAIAAGQQVALQYQGGAKSPTVYINNNLPYIQRLNEGSSKQAPAMFVQSAIAIAVSVIKGARVTTESSR